MVYWSIADDRAAFSRLLIIINFFKLVYSNELGRFDRAHRAILSENSKNKEFMKIYKLEKM